MTYVYDILLNLNKELIEFFEWEDKDNIKYVKKIPVFKTVSSLIKDIIYNEIIFDGNFVRMIPKYEMNKINLSGNLCVLTDGLMAIGVMINDNKVIYMSRFLLDEELEILEVSKDIELIDIEYKILNKKFENKKFLTRYEKDIQMRLKSEIDNLYKINDKEKLIYLYYELTNLECTNVDYIYKYLRDSLQRFDDDHKKLYNVLLLSNTNFY